MKGGYNWRGMNNSDVYFTDDLDLTDEQIKITRQTYLLHANEYVQNFERRPDALKTTRPKTLDPFLQIYKKNQLDKPILFVGCGSGRDLQELENMGLDVMGVDVCPAMLDLARENGVQSVLQEIDMEDLCFEYDSLGGIFCETAISHVKKVHLAPILKIFYNSLTINGVVMIGFREGDGHVYYTNDAVGDKRFNTTITKESSDKLIHDAGFDIIEVTNTKNPIVGRPNHLNYFIQKKS